MVSRILVKLIDEAILPAVIVITAKVWGLIFTIWLFRIRWDVDFSGGLPTISFSTFQEYYTANTYSNLVMFAVIACGFLWVTTRAHLFHTTHISPFLTLRLLSWNLTRLLTNSHQIYHKAVIWFAYLWITILLMGTQTILKASSGAVSLACFILGIFLTWLFVADIEREINI